MQIEAFINSVDTFSSYGHINGNNISLYCTKRTKDWKLYFEIDDTRVPYYNFEKIFNQMMERFIDKYNPKNMKLNTKFGFNPVKLCNDKRYKYIKEKNKIIFEKVE